MNRIVRGGGSGAEVMRSSCQMRCPATDEPGQEWVRRDSAQAADPCACGSRGAPAAHDAGAAAEVSTRSEEHTSELQSRGHLVCRLLLEKKKKPSSKDDCV